MIDSENLAQLRTESVNERFSLIDDMSVTELLQIMNEIDAEVPVAIAKANASITAAIESIVELMAQGGRLIYIGAGTSGRLGVLDAAELGPTFSVTDKEVIALIAGGQTALVHAVESAEDDEVAGKQDLKSLRLNWKDSVVGISASGRTPYVKAALEYANEVGSNTISLSSNPNSEISRYAKFPIEIDSGPEFLAGSTRLKSGTAQKLVLNMISTIAMIQLGKTFGNLMVDLQITNEKLFDRAIRIIVSATGTTKETAEVALSASGRSVKVAIVMILLDLDAQAARSKLKAGSNRIRAALDQK
jgi:N-acetylmuramic acid 6-phosphate etherase